MIEWLADILCAALGLAVLAGFWRLVRGPSVADRLLAFDIMSVSMAGLMAALSLRWHTALYLELILVFSMLGFMSTVALVHYLEKDKEDGVHPEDKP